MKQWEAIEAIIPFLQEDEAVQAIFLKGSIARGEADDYSDVDMYCMVVENHLHSFLERRLQYLRKYKDLLYYSHSNFVGPQIVAVFDDGLHFDLYTVTEKTLHETDDILVLYDPNNMLAYYNYQGLGYSEDEIKEIFHSFTFSLLEFEAAFKRGNKLWATRLASHLSGELALIIRYIFDPARSKLGFKKMNKYLPEELYQQFSEVLDLLTPSNHPQGVIKLIELCDLALLKLPETIVGNLNLIFYKFVSERVQNLNR